MAKTYGQMMDEALKIKTQEEADKWFSKEVVNMNKANPSWSFDKCCDVVRSNLGYMAGYYDYKVAKHVHKFFGAHHPIFGGCDYHKTVTPKKAFEMGQALAK